MELRFYPRDKSKSVTLHFILINQLFIKEIRFGFWVAADVAMKGPLWHDENTIMRAWVKLCILVCSTASLIMQNTGIGALKLIQ